MEINRDKYNSLLMKPVLTLQPFAVMSSSDILRIVFGKKKIYDSVPERVRKERTVKLLNFRVAHQIIQILGLEALVPSLS